MATYLIDYENVKSEGIKGIAQLGENDRVVIFYSHNADTITFEAMDMIFNSKAQVSKYKILCGGKNALDFQLSTYLGYLIHEAKDSYFYIISKDNGFKHVVDFWKRTFRFDGYVYCFATIADGNARQNRFKNASAKERARAMEEELVAMSEELEAEDSENEETPTEPAVTEVVEENASNEPAETESEETTPIETVTEESVVEKIPTGASNEELVDEEPVTKEAPTESTKAEPDLSEPLADQESDKKEQSEKESETKTSVEVERTDEESALPIDEDELLPETVIYPVQQHKPVSVMPPAQLPDSIREELKKADAEYKESSEADLKEKIAAAVSVSTIKVVESGMTIHHVEESTKKEDSVSEKSIEKPVKKSAKKSEKKSVEKNDSEKIETEVGEKPEKSHRTRRPRHKKNVEQVEEAKIEAKESVAEEPKKEKEKVEVVTEKTEKPARKPRTPKKPKEVKEEVKEQLAQKAEEPAEKAEKPAKPGRKPITRSTRAKKKETAEEVVETPVQEKPVRRGRRPKTQGNIAASFE